MVVEILVIDDNKFNNFICENIISQLLPQAKVVLIENGKNGKDEIRIDLASIKLIFPDLIMPLVDGWEILQF